MTLHKLTAGDGYLYLMRHVAKADADRVRTADAAAYYTSEGNPPGVWLGRGAQVLGLAGSTVSEAQMRNLFGLGAHPDADAMMAAYLREHTRAGMTARQLHELARAAQRHAQLGHRFAEYQPLTPLAERVAARVADLEAETGRAATGEEVGRIRRVESRRAAGAVAGYDLVFSPVKSVALVWALDPRAQVREAIRLAHEAAMTETLGFLEQHAAHTRTGHDGVAQIDTTGLVAVAFTHYDSRAGDPNLHTHVAISNKVQGTDGVWRALDGRGLHAMAVAASEHYNTRLQSHVTDRLGVAFEARATVRGGQPVMEIAGIEQQVLDHFSRRRAQLEARYDQLLAEYRAAHGTDPDVGVARDLAQRANLETRRAKGPVRSLADMRTAWREDLRSTFGRTALHQVMSAIPDHPPTPRRAAAEADVLALTPGTPDHAGLVQALAAGVVAAVEGKRSTWTVWNLRAETERALRDPATTRQHPALAAATPAQLAALAEQVTAHATGPGLSLSVETPALASEPASLRRADGQSVFDRHASQRFTSQRVLDAEHRLLTAATTLPEPALPAPSRDQVAAVLEGLRERDGLQLDPGQAALVTAFAADPRAVVVGLGAAGTGKTTAMRALRTVLEQTGPGRLIPLASSAHAASVLAAELGVRAENVHKFLWDHADGNRHRIPMRPGDVVLVDEAGMAGTPNLDRVLALAQQVGARVRLLGDDRQLAAVESGGALRLLAHEAGAVELDVVHRFTDPAEAAATLQLRTGDHQGLAFYQARGRITGGSLQAMTDAAYTAWLADVHAGKTSVLATTTTADVTRLAARARADRVAAGQVEPGGVLLHDGNTAGVGDWVLTRANDRRLTDRHATTWVRNGEGWRVVHRRRDGALTVEHLATNARLVLPPAYVAAHVELLYATTAHRVQGATVDTTHALVTAEAAREHLYVLATRARQSTHLYVQTHQVLPADTDERIDRRRWDPAGVDASVILQRILDREAAEVSATQALRDAQNAATSLATLVPRHRHAVAVATADIYEHVLDEVLTAEDAAEARRDEAHPQLLDALRRAHQHGWQPEQALVRAVRDAVADHAAADAVSDTGEEQLSAWSMTRRAAANLRALADSRAVPVPLARPTPEDLDRYTEMLRAAGIDVFRARTAGALDQPAALTAPAFDAPAGSGRRARGEITSASYRQDLVRALPRGLAHAAATPADPAAWRALQRVLHRAERAGHDVADLLAAPALRAGLTGDADTATCLTERLIRHLVDHPTPILTGLQARGTDGATHAFTHLAWAMKAAEQRGESPTSLLAAPQDTPPSQGTRGPQPSLAAAWLRAQHTHRADPPAGALPWAPDPVPGTVTDPADAAYLDQIRDLITARVATLRADLDAAITAGDLPGWTVSLDTAYARYHHTRPRWLDHTSLVAAFRDQYAPATADPDQPLGAHPEPAPHTDHQHARAHAAAAAELAAAWDVAHPVGTRHITGAETAEPTDPADLETRRQIATTTWHALAPQRQYAVAATVLARLGNLPEPTPTTTPPTQTGPENVEIRPGYTGLDEALTHPKILPALHRALVQAGHLPDPDHDPGHDTAAADQQVVQGGQRRRPADPRPIPPRRVRPVRRPPVARPDPQPRQTEPQPQPDPRHKYDPQPGRPIQPRPGRQYRL